MSRLISDDAFDLIVAEEVSSKAVYAKQYQRPEWPGGASGITVGIGYDCGYSTAAQIRADWAGRIPDVMIEALASRAAGLKGEAAHKRLAEVRPRVSVPWDAAISEFSDVEIPRWVAKVRKTLPNTDTLSPDCLGALVSLAYNRGEGVFTAAGPRYKEGRAIHQHMRDGQLELIPDEFRRMKRLWQGTSVRGLVGRREREAKLFERGLKAQVATVADLPADPAPVIPVTTIDNAVVGDPVIFSIQSRLKAMNYSPGRLDGKWGGATAGAIGAFLNDRDTQIVAPTSLDQFNAVKAALTAELQKAESENFTRPVSAARASADPAVVAEVAPEVKPAKRGFLAAAWASALAFVSSIFDTVSGYVQSAWAFWTDHKDDVPSDSGLLSSAWDMLGKVPTVVWLALAGCGFAFVAFSARQSVQKITQSVQSGARQ